MTTATIKMKVPTKKPSVQPVDTPGVSNAKKSPDILEPNLKLIAQVVRVLELRQRKGTSSTKTRGEVRGGGRKPWKQKGTGRARHGSIRSPIWRGGGVVFGPRPERHYKLEVPQAMRNLAAAQLLDVKKAEDNLVTVEQWPFKQGKTKEAIKFLEGVKQKGTYLLLSETLPDAMKRATSNLPDVHLQTIHNVNARDILYSDVVVVDKTSLEKLNNRLKA